MQIGMTISGVKRTYPFKTKQYLQLNVKIYKNRNIVFQKKGI